METVKDVFNKFRQQLQNLYDGNEIQALTLAVLTHYTGSTKASLKAFPEKELNPDQSEAISNALTELLTGKPLQYILGETEFYGLTFKVNPSVLIPRPETEELVEWAISLQGAQGEAPGADTKLRILDIGTGSGCIAISLKKNLREAEVSAIDISPAALQTAQGNALLNGVTVNFIEADILSVPSNAAMNTAPYSLIISNPPYVTPADKKQMHTNVTDFEPHTALFVPQNDPLLFYKAIADFAVKHLQNGGLLFFEINESYGPDTVKMLAEKGFTAIELRKDMSNRDRMVKAVLDRSIN